MKPLALILACLFTLTPHSALAEPLLAHTYPIENVRDIRVGGGASVEIRQGDSESLRAEAVKEVLDRVSVDLSGARLTLGIKSGSGGGWFKWFNNQHDQVKFIIQIKDLSRLELGGATSATISDLKVGDLRLHLNGSSRAEMARIQGADFKVDLSGAGHLTIAEFNGNSIEADLSGASQMQIKSGAADTLRVDVSGASQYYSRNVGNQTARAHASGASHIEVRVSDFIDAKASGASHINIYGNPRSDRHSSGASHINVHNE
jgi:hypothetical protein